MARNSSDGCIGQLLVIPIIFVIGFIVDTCNNSESSLIKEARSSGQEYKYRTYLDKYPNGDYLEEALDSIYSITIRMKNPECSIERIYNIANNDGVKGSRIEKPLKDFVYNAVIKANSEYYWKKFVEVADEEYIKDSEAKREELEYSAWGTDDLAWQTSQKANSPYAYKKYMDLYPRGNHFKEAKKLYVKLSVAMDSQGTYNELPSMDKISGGGSRSTISISNGTSYELNVFYSGPDYETACIPAGSSQSITIPNGTYKISARVSDHSVRPCYGTETVSGGHYSVSYYISTSRY